ncbi:MAG: HEPN domain-containing protein [Actinomycetota bacterium]
MVSRVRTVAVSEAEAKVFLDKAKQFMESAEDALEKGNWDAAAHNVVHAVISVNDALLGARHGMRSAGQSHKDAATLLAEKEATADAKKNAARFLKVVNKKNLVQYEGRSVTEAEGRALMRDATRFYDWATDKVG